jgi:hypothetical protein
MRQNAWILSAFAALQKARRGHRPANVHDAFSVGPRLSARGLVRYDQPFGGRKNLELAAPGFSCFPQVKITFHISGV